jgi:hypothetical protein
LKLLKEPGELLEVHLGDEIIDITSAEDRNEVGTKPKHKSLEIRMAEFGALVKEKKAKIDALMKEWDDVQVEIIRLAAEVFGPDAIMAPLPRRTNEPQLDVNEAVKRTKVDYDRKQAKFQDVIKGIEGMEERSENLKTNTLSTLKEQQKVCVLHIISLSLTCIRNTNAATENMLQISRSLQSHSRPKSFKNMLCTDETPSIPQ